MNVLDRTHFNRLKNGAILANSGHFNVEINLNALSSITRYTRKIRPNLEEYILIDGRKLYLIAEGRLVNLAAAEGHPSEVMDMSFANQALVAEWVWTSPKLKIGVHEVPRSIDNKVAELKLQGMGITIDSLTKEQNRYLSNWRIGT
jgi:adenosylhomocysteinase